MCAGIKVVMDRCSKIEHARLLHLDLLRLAQRWEQVLELDPTDEPAEMFGKVTGCSRGRGGSMHLFDTSRRFYGGNAIVGGGLPLSIGLALADHMRGQVIRARSLAPAVGDGVDLAAVSPGELLPALAELTRAVAAIKAAIGEEGRIHLVNRRLLTRVIPARQVIQSDVIVG